MTIFLKHSYVCLFYTDCNSVMVVSMGPYSRAFSRMWLALTDCGLVDVIQRKCSCYLSSNFYPSVQYMKVYMFGISTGKCHFGVL